MSGPETLPCRGSARHFPGEAFSAATPHKCLRPSPVPRSLPVPSALFGSRTRISHHMLGLSSAPRCLPCLELGVWSAGTSSRLSLLRLQRAGRSVSGQVGRGLPGTWREVLVPPSGLSPHAWVVTRAWHPCKPQCGGHFWVLCSACRQRACGPGPQAGVSAAPVLLRAPGTPTGLRSRSPLCTQPFPLCAFSRPPLPPRAPGSLWLPLPRDKGSLGPAHVLDFSWSHCFVIFWCKIVMIPAVAGLAQQ